MSFQMIAPQRVTQLRRAVWKRCAALLLGVLGCSGDVSSPNPAHTGDVVWTVELNVHRAVMSTKAPYNTLRLVAVPRSASGAALSYAGTPTFSVSDLSLSVTSDGVVTALSPRPQAFVVATLRDSVTLVTHTDTLFIEITEEDHPVKLAMLSIQPVSGDSSKRSLDSLTALPFLAIDSTGHNISAQIPKWFLSRGPGMLTIDRETGLVTNGIPNRTTTVIAEISYYGVTLRDSVSYTIGSVLTGFIEGGNIDGKSTNPFDFTISRLTIGVGGTVVFKSGFTFAPDFQSIMPSPAFDVQFDDPQAVKASPLTNHNGWLIPVDSGNIGTLQTPGGAVSDVLVACIVGTAPCSAARSFPKAGIYTFRDSHSGITGSIVVK